MALEDEVAAILDLGDGVEARQVDPGALLARELRPENQRPVVKPPPDDVGAQPIGGRLQRRDVGDGEEGVVGLAEADLRPLQLLLDEAVAVEVVGGPEGEERRHPQHHRSERLVADVEIVVGEAAALRRQNTMIGILGGIARHGDAEGRALLHAPEDEIDAVAVVPRHAPLPRQDVVLLAHALLGPHDGDPVVARERLHPVAVVVRPPAQDFLVDRRNADDPAEEVHHLLGARQPAKIAVDDNAVEAMVDEGQQVAEERGEDGHDTHPARNDPAPIGQTPPRKPATPSRR